MKITKAIEVNVKGIIGIKIFGLKIMTKMSEPARNIANSNKNHVEMKNKIEKIARIFLYLFEVNAATRNAPEMICEQTAIKAITSSSIEINS